MVGAAQVRAIERRQARKAAPHARSPQTPKLIY